MIADDFEQPLENGGALTSAGSREILGNGVENRSPSNSKKHVGVSVGDE